MTDFGRFIGEVKTQWCEDGEESCMRLTEPFGYVTPDGHTYTAEAGFDTDGASIPRFFWRFIGNPLQGHYRRAAVIHDWLCVNGYRLGIPSARVHQIFYWAMRCAGVGAVKASLMYWAVRTFGPRWRAE